MINVKETLLADLSKSSNVYTTAINAQVTLCDEDKNYYPTRHTVVDNFTDLFLFGWDFV